MVVVVALAVLMLTAFVLARKWQSADTAYQRLEAPADCDLRAGPCRQRVADGEVQLTLSPAAIPLMQTLSVSVVTSGLQAERVTVEIRGLNMDMGLNRTRLEQVGSGAWAGETILPICSQRRMEWEAAVRVDGLGRFEIPFPFATTRP